MVVTAAGGKSYTTGNIRSNILNGFFLRRDLDIAVPCIPGAALVFAFVQAPLSCLPVYSVNFPELFCLC